MPAPPDNGDKKSNDLSDQLRQSVATAYSFVKSNEKIQTFSAITLEELLDKQIDRLEGNGTQTRPSMKSRIDKIEKDFQQAVDQIKNLPDTFFAEEDPETGVNTAAEPKEG